MRATRLIRQSSHMKYSWLNELVKVRQEAIRNTREHPPLPLRSVEFQKHFSHRGQVGISEILGSHHRLYETVKLHVEDCVIRDVVEVQRISRMSNFSRAFGEPNVQRRDAFMVDGSKRVTVTAGKFDTLASTTSFSSKNHVQKRRNMERISTSKTSSPALRVRRRPKWFKS